MEHAGVQRLVCHAAASETCIIAAVVLHNQTQPSATQHNFVSVCEQDVNRLNVRPYCIQGHTVLYQALSAFATGLKFC